MLEVADIFREAGPAYRQQYASRMLPSHLKVMEAIETCRTEAMGGHLRQCDECEQFQYSYHSCCNRHCPKCHGDQSRRWLDKQRNRSLDCSYFLLTFTIAKQLRPLARRHQKLFYGLLMRCAAHSLTKLANNPKFLGAKPAIIAVLHTWTRAMLYHPHVHLLVTAGGLSQDGKRWLEPRNPKFLVPCGALSVIFRAKLRDALDKAELLQHTPADAWRRRWVVHCKHAGNGDKVLEYLARYVYRIAIANSRIESFNNGQVTFRYYDTKTHELRRCTLPAEQFISRFLQHVLPQSFTKVRYYGLYCSASAHHLERAKAVLSEPDSTASPDSESLDALDDQHPDKPDEPLCPLCRVGHMHVVATLTRSVTINARKKKPP